ncbi:hypothetical protein [Paraburkholderia bonniea]|uniref:hypothetical protein n=1 Tax=Paraburkholderia bonniea TaxID=2152891 RepID=UPI0012908F2C|nr:hypothetical protein [Paraburkholderia bonniea]
MSDENRKVLAKKKITGFLFGENGGIGFYKIKISGSKGLYSTDFRQWVYEALEETDTSEGKYFISSLYFSFRLIDSKIAPPDTAILIKYKTHDLDTCATRTDGFENDPSLCAPTSNTNTISKADLIFKRRQQYESILSKLHHDLSLQEKISKPAWYQRHPSVEKTNYAAYQCKELKEQIALKTSIPDISQFNRLETMEIKFK